MEKTTAFVLDLIDRTLCGKNQQAAKELWDVLTALRGPDQPNWSWDVKDVWTVPIRAKAFPKSVAKIQAAQDAYVACGGRAMMVPLEDADELRKLRSARPASMCGSHYAEHIRKANEVLGLPEFD